MDSAQLQALSAQLQKGGPAAPPTGAKPCGPSPIAELERGASVLNATNTGDLAGVLSFPAPDGAGTPIQSDADEQLLVTMELRQPYKIHSIKIAAPDADSAPKSLKIFANKTNMSFEDAEDFPPTQQLEVSGVAQTLPLQFVKFQNVHSLTIFIDGNQGDVESTAISRIELLGQPLATTDMKNLKKVG